MFQIKISVTIFAPKKVVWGVICDAKSYPIWNTFIVACESTFEVGSPIIMKVRLAPLGIIQQTETISQNRNEEFVEYKTAFPFGLLSSSRQHILTEIDANTTEYTSFWETKGLLSPLNRLLFGKQLAWGFQKMTLGIKAEAEKQHL
jgi:hypothetical protein